MDRSFGTLGVKIRNGPVYAGWASSPLGSLAGAAISLVPESRAHRVGGSVAATAVMAPVLGPLPLLGMLAKKDRATVYIQFTNGRLYQKTIKGNFAVRSAHAEAMQFQAMAQRIENEQRREGGSHPLSLRTSQRREAGSHPLSELSWTRYAAGWTLDLGATTAARTQATKTTSRPSLN